MTALQLKLRKMKMEKLAIQHKAELKDKEFKSQCDQLNHMKESKK